MIPFASNLTLTPPKIAAAVQAMLQLARVDGEKTQEEIDLIRGFYDTCGQSQDLPPFQTLLDRAAGHAEVDAGVFTQAEERELVVTFGLMVAFADGTFSSAEREAVLGLARRLGVPDERFEEILRVVKDQLLAELSRLPDAPSVAKVARELG